MESTPMVEELKKLNLAFRAISDDEEESSPAPEEDELEEGEEDLEFDEGEEKPDEGSE